MNNFFREIKSNKTLILMVFLAVALPLTAGLVLENQENRSQAAYKQLGSSCNATSSCQPPLICSGGKCKNETVVRTGNRGLNQSCTTIADCKSPYVCYNGICKVRSGGECSRSIDCYGNHYCSVSNRHCRKIDSMWVGDASVEGKTVSSMLGISSRVTKTPTKSPTKTPTVGPTINPTANPTRKPMVEPTSSPIIEPTKIVVPIILKNPVISFEFSFLGVKPESTCINSLGLLETEVFNVFKSSRQDGLEIKPEIVKNKVNNRGDQIFLVKNLSLDESKFGDVNDFNYLLIKGPFHLRKKMCIDGQTSKLSETVECKINLYSDKVYDFSNHPLSAGDINKDGTVNGADFGFIKNNLGMGDGVVCGKSGDLNFDGLINGIDIQLIKETLAYREDE